MSTIIIARHGNTFEANETAVRIGLKTDLPLSSSGLIQAQNLGHYLKRNHIQPSHVYVSNLKRTQQMARIALDIAGLRITPIELAMFNEIDYGVDEGKTNEQIIARIGSKALDAWENAATPPPGWLVEPQHIINNWHEFARQVLPQETVFVITSNGIARFAPYLTNDFESFTQQHNIKLATGAVGALTRENEVWKIDYWNERPRAE